MYPKSKLSTNEGAMKLHAIKLTFLAVIVSAALMIACQPGFAQQGESADSTSKSKEKAEPLPGLAELVHKAAKLDERYSNFLKPICMFAL